MNVLSNLIRIYLREHIIKRMCKGNRIHRSNCHNSNRCSWISQRFPQEMLIRLCSEWEQQINLGRRKISCFQEDMHCLRISKRNRFRIVDLRVVRIKEIAIIMVARVRFHQGFTMTNLFIGRNKNVSLSLFHGKNYLFQN